MTYGPRHREDWLEWKTVVYPGGWYDFSGALVADRSKSIDHGSYRIMDDVVTENFISRSAAGEFINNPCSRQLVYVLHNPLEGFTHNKDAPTTLGEWYDFHGFFPSIGLAGTSVELLNAIDSETLEDLRIRAGTKAYARVSSDEMSMLVMLAELKETKDMLLGCLNALNKLRQMIVKKLPLWVLDGVPEPFSFWMYIRYGWRPFYYEVMQLRDFMKRKTEKEFAQRQTFRSGIPYGQSTVRDTAVASYSSGTGSHVHTWTRESQVLGVVKAGVIAVQRFAGFPDTYGLTKLPMAVYDLTKLSWAISWFLNIADVISAWTPDTLWDPRISWTTDVLTHSQRNVISNFSCTDGNHSSCTRSGGVYHKITDIYYRSPVAKRGIVPSVRLNFDTYKLIDSIALAKQFWCQFFNANLRQLVRAKNPKRRR